MERLLEFAQGPLFKFAIAILVLGLVRHAALSIVGFVKAHGRAGRKGIDVGALVGLTLRQANPLRYLTRTRGIYTALTMLLHVGILVVPLFLAGHVVLWQKGLGFGWWYLPAEVADALTLITIGAAVAVIVGRLSNGASRGISRPQDWALPPLLAMIFVSGWLMAHPGHDVLPYTTTRLIHVLCGDLVLMSIPFTKLAHMVLLPLSQLPVDMGWRFVPGSGAEVRRTLGKEGQKI